MTLEDLLSLLDKGAEKANKPRKVTIDGWGTVYIRALTIAEVDEQNEEIDEKSKASLVRGIARLLCDDTGKRLLDPNNKDHLKRLGKNSWADLRQLLAASNDEIKGDAEKK